MAKVILLSQIQMPFHKIGSWTTLYKNYLSDSHSIDYIVCEKPFNDVLPVEYSFVSTSCASKIVKKITKKPYKNYLQALFKIVRPMENYVIQIVDNFGIVKHLRDELEKKGIRANIYIQFFYHGYSPFCKNIEDSWFFEFIDEMVLLTNLSYEEHKKYYTVLPTKFSVLHNGIDTHKFFKVDAVQKEKLKHKFNVTDKKVFVWCSQDRPKKGLDLILDVWKRVYSEEKNIELWVIGANRSQSQAGVKFFGKIENDLLPEYLQASDVYLFPTLWHEGFGLSLIEALHCGNFCIASAIGGVPEVLQYGKLGKLIEHPHFVAEWVGAIEELLQQPQSAIVIPDGLYSKESWNTGMNTLIEHAKLSLSK